MDEQMNQLQHLEQSMQQILSQKQAIHAQQIETTTAQEEVDQSEGPVYKVIGGIMVATKKESIKKELDEKKEMIDLRMKSLEKQENQIKEKIEAIQEEMMKGQKNE